MYLAPARHRPVLSRLWARSLSSLPLTIKQVLNHKPEPQSETVTVHGWIKSIRKQKRYAFAEIRDGTTHKTLQAVIQAESARLLTNGASVALRGHVVHTPKAPQPMELSVQEVDVLGGCDPEMYPIQKQSLSVAHLRDHVHLRPRTSNIATMLRLRDQVSRHFHEFYEQRGFVHVHTPILTANDCEGGGEVFRIQPEEALPAAAGVPTKAHEFFGKPAYLTVSSQLHLEALASSLSRVYTISPTFRAETSQTNRHLSEFWMLEAELSFTKDVNVVMDVVEHSIKHVLRRLACDDGGMVEELQELQVSLATGWEGKQRVSPTPTLSWRDVIDQPWRRITYTEAIRALSGGSSAPVWGEGLSSDHEKQLAALSGGPVFVTDYPARLKPFYMRANEESGDTPGPTVACFDLLVPTVAELVGGSVREERIELLEKAMAQQGLSASEYAWYLDLRRYGGVPHGGFGVGFERLISWVSGIENVRECIAFPRWAGRMAG